MLEKIQFMITGELKSKVDKICETFFDRRINKSIRS